MSLQKNGDARRQARGRRSPSPRSPMPARSCRSGRTTTTPSDRTLASAISRLRPTSKPAPPDRNGTGRCATRRAPRLVPLLRRANKAQINLGLYSSLDERRGSGHLVGDFLFKRLAIVVASLPLIITPSLGMPDTNKIVQVVLMKRDRNADRYFRINRLRI